MIDTDDTMRKILPEGRLGIFQAQVSVRDSGTDILGYIDPVVKQLSGTLRLEEVSSQPLIAQTKTAYRLLGKDPTRYRPSAEALRRRIASGKDLYRVNNVVDLLNFISIQTGFSIGGYDAGKIEGPILFGQGRASEPYEAIGRGDLNIHLLPVLRDETGAFGSPTSDSVRTMVTSATRHFLMVIFDFFGEGDLEQVLSDSMALYDRFTGARDMNYFIEYF